MTDNVVLYSAIYGAYDKPKPLPADLGCPAVMFTDNPALDAPGWDVRYLPLGAITTPMMQAKYVKTHPHVLFPDHEISLWLDGSMTIVVPDYAARCVDALAGESWAMVQHPARDCIYDEAEFSARLDRYPADMLLRQVAVYRDLWGHPAHWGLVATGANARRHHAPTVRGANEMWWLENVVESWQDQLSLPPVLRRLGGHLTWNTNLPWHTWWHITDHGA